MKNNSQHQEDVEQIRQEIVKESQKNSAKPFTLETHTSNVTRDFSYKQNRSKLSINKLNQVIKIDPVKKVALVEPRVTMEQLHEVVFKHGFVVPVIPEFKGITVGGAINGAAIESSSHRYGQFNDICTGYEVILGDGSLVWVSENEHQDLYNAIAGSYGTLGIITLAEIKLIDAATNVNLQVHHFEKFNDAIEFMRKLKDMPEAPEYLEGIIFSETHSIVVEGNQCNVSKNENRISFSKPWSPWYYPLMKNRKKNSWTIPLTDYLFRHDRGAFWMGAYAVRLSLLFRYICEGIFKIRFPFTSFDKSASTYADIKEPGPIFRLVFGWMMPSQRLYRLLHTGTENWFADKFIIQDFYIPEDNAENFVKESLNENGITPIWLCPVRKTQQFQLFSPHNHSSQQDFIDIGLYGLPKKFSSIKKITKELEKLTQKTGGRKMLYSHSYYSPEEFWKIYPENEYRSMRKKYHGEKMWLSIEDKVLAEKQNPH